MDEMDDYYRNKISLCPKYIEWTRLPDEEKMVYCKKTYCKPVDEIKLLAHIKRNIVTNDRATQKRKKQKSDCTPSDELLEKVKNSNVYKEFMKLEPGKTIFYDSRYYVSGNAADTIKLMKRISNRINCNTRRTSAKKKGNSVDVESEKRSSIVADSVVTGDVFADSMGMDVEIENAAVALLSLDNPGRGDATSPRCDVVIKEGSADAEEVYGKNDNINFEADSDNLGWDEKELDNPGGEGNAIAEKVAKRKDDNNFDGDSDNLERGTEESALTNNGAIDQGSDVGVDYGSMDNEDEIGLIFNLEGKETKVCLRYFGSYVKFSKECYHKGYKSGSVHTYLSAQLFSAPTGRRLQVRNDVATFETGLIEEELCSSMLNKISKAIQQGWEEKYMNSKYNAPRLFQLRKVNQKKTRKIDQANFSDPDLVEVRQLIEIFEKIYQNTIRVTEVWFLKKKNKGDGFEDFHYDYKTVKGGMNDVSSTIVVNLGVFPNASERAGEEDDEEAENGNEDDEDNADGQVEEISDAMGEQCGGYQVPPSSRKPGLPMEVEGTKETRWDFHKALMQDISDEEEELIHRSINQDLKLPWGISSQHLSKLLQGPINMDIIEVYLTRYLSHQDEKLCEKDPTRSKSVFYLYFLKNYYDVNTENYIYNNVKNYSRRNKVPDGDIFKTKYIFIPIHQVKHFTCAVIYMQDKRIMYYDSYLNTSRTRTSCSHKKDRQESILKALFQYLKDEHLHKHSVELPDQNLWNLQSLCDAPQQDNTEDCGIFVCLYCELILHDLDLTFTQDQIKKGNWRKKMILSILSIKDDIRNDDNDENANEVEYLPSSEINPSVQLPKLPVKAKQIVSNSKWGKSVITTNDCTGNLNALVECKEDCQGGMNCSNKRIQRGLWKKVESKVTQGCGNGLFTMEDLKKGDFIIEYVGKIVYEDPDNVYGMKIADMDLWIDPTKTDCPAKYMNYSCEPNCHLEQWAVNGLPRMCLFATEDIKSGEELTFDYNWELKAVNKYMFLKNATKCNCGKETCRKFIERMKIQRMQLRG